MTDLQNAIVAYAVARLQKRFDRLSKRKVVLFPVLRARLLLRTLHKLSGLVK